MSSNSSTHPPPERSLSAPVAMDRGMPASEFPPVLVMYHPSMKELAQNLVKRVNDVNKPFEDGKVS